MGENCPPRVLTGAGTGKFYPRGDGDGRLIPDGEFPVAIPSRGERAPPPYPAAGQASQHLPKDLTKFALPLVAPHYACTRRSSSRGSRAAAVSPLQLVGATAGRATTTNRFVVSSIEALCRLFISSGCGSPRASSPGRRRVRL
jgi:hypothetical protein